MRWFAEDKAGYMKYEGDNLGLGITTECYAETTGFQREDIRMRWGMFEQRQAGSGNDVLCLC